MTLAPLLLSAVTASRLIELLIARRNTSRLLLKGGREVAAGHYPLIVLLHGLWLAALWRYGWNQPLNLGWLAIFLILQGFRVWTLASLGPRWTTRIIVLPGAALTTTGPYRYLSHPNYLIVIGEIAVLPLCLGLPWLAAWFSISNLAILAVRIRAENSVLLEVVDVNHK